MTKQKVIWIDGDYTPVRNYIAESGCKHIFMVCGNSAKELAIYKTFMELPKDIDVVTFSDFAPNPEYRSVTAGICCCSEKCDMIVAIGGGSAIDVAKCIKLFISANHMDRDIRFVAVPTTAGTGAESTQFAVIYKEGKKCSVSNEDCLPHLVVLDPSALDTLPEYQRKATLLDTLCHGIESYWSVKSTEESRRYADEAIRLVMKHMDGYIANVPADNAGMLKAANLAGRAINISQTTAGHAMCYKLTGLYGIAHGHAAALCVEQLLSHMAASIREMSMDCNVNCNASCLDIRGAKYLREMFCRMEGALGCANESSEMPVAHGCMEESTRTAEVMECQRRSGFDYGTDALGMGACEKMRTILDKLALDVPKASESDIDILKKSVNAERLANYPVRLDERDIEEMYRGILRV